MNPPTTTPAADPSQHPTLQPGEAILPPPEERLSVLVERSFSQLLQSDTVQKIIHTQLEKTIGSIITDTISGYHSPFKKALETYVAQAMPMKLDSIGLAGYQGTILSIIKSKLDASLQQWVEKGMAEHLEELMAPPPESLTIEDLEDMLRKEQDEDDGDEISIMTCPNDTDHDVAHLPPKEKEEAFLRIPVMRGYHGVLGWLAISQNDARHIAAQAIAGHKAELSFVIQGDTMLLHSITFGWEPAVAQTGTSNSEPRTENCTP